MDMIVYIGTKTVKAFPMSRLAYNEYRGWVLPVNEDPADEGYLVEYLDGGKPCDDRHEGYISWSPKAVFEQSYKPQGTWLDRVKAEHEHESTKLAALDKMLSGLKPDNVSDKQWIFMNRQQFHMRMMVQILADRIAEAEGEDVPLMRTPVKHIAVSDADKFINEYQVTPNVGGSEDTAVSDLGRPLHRTTQGYSATFDLHVPIQTKEKE